MALADHRTGTCRANDVTLFYRAFGESGATPILIVHGLSFFSYDYIEIAAQLAGDREVVAMDLRGFGDSTWSPTQDYSLDAFSGDFAALLDHLGWAKAHMLAHSMGGRHCVYFAARHPERIARMLLLDYAPNNAPAGQQRVTNAVADVPDVFESVSAAMAYYGKDPNAPADHPDRKRFEAYTRQVEGGFIIKRDDVYRQRFRKARETGERPKLGVDMWEVLGMVSAPMRFIRGKRSDMFAQEAVEQVRAANANIEVVELDTAHNVAGDDPDGVIRHAKSFLVD